MTDLRETVNKKLQKKLREYSQTTIAKTTRSVENDKTLTNHSARKNENDFAYNT